MMKKSVQFNNSETIVSAAPPGSWGVTHDGCSHCWPPCPGLNCWLLPHKHVHSPWSLLLSQLYWLAVYICQFTFACVIWNPKLYPRLANIEHYHQTTTTLGIWLPGKMSYEAYFYLKWHIKWNVGNVMILYSRLLFWRWRFFSYLWFVFVNLFYSVWWIEMNALGYWSSWICHF